MPRLIFKAVSKGPGPMSSVLWEKIAAQVSHAAMYGFMIVMPVTGVAMGYYGGKGLPIFFTSIPGAEKPDGKQAGWFYKWHKKLGTERTKNTDQIKAMLKYIPFLQTLNRMVYGDAILRASWWRGLSHDPWRKHSGSYPATCGEEVKTEQRLSLHVWVVNPAHTRIHEYRATCLVE